MKFYKLYIFAFFLLLSKMAAGSHISGGELFYRYMGPGTAANTDRYAVTVRLFRECNSTGQQLNTETVIVAIYDTPTDTLFTSLYLPQQWVGDPPVLQNTPSAIPCLSGDGSLCYQIGLFSDTIDLPKSAGGYTLSWVRCCRQQVTNVQNTPYPDSAQGSTFLTHIPGTNVLPNGYNNSAEFVVKDTVVVCAAHNFTLDFSAFDPDNDSLAYTFCDAYTGATPNDPNPNYSDGAASLLSLTPLPYISPYYGGSPLGAPVTINVKTGFISGIAPATPGKYVVMVCVEEYRQGVLLNIHHKDFILKIADCEFASAQLNPSYLTCNGFGLQFENQSASPLIYSYFWDFGIPGSTIDTSTQPQPFYNFPDSGTYNVKLVVNRGGTCGDSTTTQAQIYPGFTANFGFIVKCLPQLTAFVDSSSTKFGQVTGWQWNFGDSLGSSNSQNPSYQYQSAGARNVTLTVSNTKGCTDSITKQIFVPAPPVLSVLPAQDTAICDLDSLHLSATATPLSVFSWSPNSHIINSDSASAVVFPSTQTTYTVAATDSSGCGATASITVRVNQLPTVVTLPDTVMCSGTSITLLTTSTGSTYSWQPATGLSDSTALSPAAAPQATTQYVVVAKTTSGCLAKDTVTVRVNISPTVATSPDSLICAGGSALLSASSPENVYYSWYPATGLSNPLSATTLASPLQTTTYQATVTDSNACTMVKNVVITVVPKPVFAITPPYKNICLGDSLLFTASGGDAYQWYPATNITNDTAAAATVFPSVTTTYIVIITSNACHIVDTVQATANVSQPFRLTLTKSNDIDCFNAQATLHAYGGTTYTWSSAETLNNQYTASPTVAPLETTTYYVTAGNGTACIERDSIQVKLITNNGQNGYKVASAFTPNGDGHNDCFGVKDWGGINSIQFSVYNRWGNRVFYSESASGCWDGTYKGLPLAAGTFVYQIWASTICGPVYRKGTVVLVR